MNTKVEYLAAAIVELDSEDRYDLAFRILALDADVADSLSCCLGFAFQDAEERRLKRAA
jgi:hypothetical protein